MQDAESRAGFESQREALVQKALAARLKELDKPKKDEDSKDKTEPAKGQKPPGHWERARELEGLYGKGYDKHTCQDE